MGYHMNHCQMINRHLHFIFQALTQMHMNT